MRVLGGFSVLFLLVGTLVFSTAATTSLPDMSLMENGNMGMASTYNRKLKEHTLSNNNNNKKDAGKVNIDDYRPIDPVPSSKASITNGPIEHGSPLMPYIPKPETPPKHNGP